MIRPTHCKQNRNHQQKMSQQRGFSLIELLVASALSILLLAGLVSAYLSVKSSYNMQDAINRMQESARFSLNLLEQRIRMAGYSRCVDGKQTNQVLAIKGYDWAHFVLNSDVVIGSDVVVIGICHFDAALGHENFEQIAFYVGHTHRKNSQGKAIDALYEQPLDGAKEELVAGVEQMRIRYGIVTNHPKDISQYVAAAQVVDWKKVYALEINLLFNSIEPIFKSPQPFYFNHQTIIPVDHLLHRSWINYITLRERPRIAMDL